MHHNLPGIVLYIIVYFYITFSGISKARCACVSMVRILYYSLLQYSTISSAPRVCTLVLFHIILYNSHDCILLYTKLDTA